ncbi:MAG: hypothetical protein ACFB9M_08025 [Myxococcota bacterium]
MDVARLFFACSLCLVLGFGGGVAATRALYGEPHEPIRPHPSASAPTAHLQCPICPAPPPCPGESVVPTAAADGAPTAWVEQLDEQVLPGLPLKVVQEAQRQVTDVASECFEPSVDLDGVVQLELTLTATGGSARVRDALALTNTFQDPDLSACLTEAARSVQFAYPEGEGRATFKLALRP